MASEDDFDALIVKCNEILENCIRKARFISGMKEIKSTHLPQIIKCREIFRDSMVRIARLIDEMKEPSPMEAELEEKNAIVLELKSCLAKRDARLAERDARLAERDARLAERDARLAERDARLAERNTLILELQNRLVEAEKNQKNMHDIIQELKGNMRQT